MDFCENLLSKLAFNTLLSNQILCALRQKLLFTILLLISVGLQANIAQDIHKSATPAWVKPITLPSIDNIPTAQVKNGIYYLLLDDQVKVDIKGEPIYFTRYAEHIINTDGVENSSQINLDFDPNYQAISLHSLRVHRAGQIIDKINTSRLTFLQREQEMDKLIYSGVQTLNIVLDDVRVGDTLEYSYSIQGMNPVYDGIFAYHNGLSWGVPVGYLSRRILWNKPVPLHFQVKQSPLTVMYSTGEFGSEYLIQGENIQPLRIDDDAPDWFDPWGSVSFSELDTWSDVAVWGRSLYDNVLVSDDEIKRLVEDIKAKHSDSKAQIAAALQFTQQQIRYLGIELGVNSHKPRVAHETLRNRYGDCKDKTVLLITLLKELGITAYPALVNTNRKLDDMLPNNRAFNHVITFVELNNQHYWLDPTRNYQYGGLDFVHQPDYEFALVLAEHTQALNEMTSKQAPYGSSTVDHFNLKDATLFSSETTYRGWNAEKARYQLASKGQEQLQHDYQSFFQSYYPGLKAQKTLQVADNKLENIIVFREQYTIDNFWNDDSENQQKDTDFYGNIVSQWISVPDQKQRRHPLALVYPLQVKQQINVDLDDNQWHFENKQFIEDNRFFTFTHSVSFAKSENRLTLNYAFATKVKFVSAQDYPEYRQALEKTSHYKRYGIYKSTAPDSQDMPQQIEKSWDAGTIILIYFLLYILAFVLWRVSCKRRKAANDALFYPVLSVKLLVLWVLTFGLYGMYWFYRNFHYIKQQNGDASMPFARGFFYIFWYYPLWKSLKLDSEEREQKNSLPCKWLAILLAILFVLLGLFNRGSSFAMLIIAFSALLVLPLANYINHINGKGSSAFKINSRWRVHHYLLIVLSLPICVLTIGSELGLTPSESVISGNRLLTHNVQFMQRQGIIKATDNVQYFYSDAFLFIKDDGNGFTQRHVFSYWRDEQGKLEKQIASYQDIEKIDVKSATDAWDNSIITITRKDGSDFMLYVSAIDKKDKLFIKKLKSNWRQYR